jgi:hypothetical protein
MKEFMNLELSGPATLTAVVQAVLQLAAQDETQIMGLASSGKFRRAFPFRPSAPEREPTDYVSGDELVQASPGPLSAAQRATLIQSSMPAQRAQGSEQHPQSMQHESEQAAFGTDLVRALYENQK